MPAGAVTQKPQALPGIIGRKECVGGNVSPLLNRLTQLDKSKGNGIARGCERHTELIV